MYELKSSLRSMDRGRSGVADEHKDHPAWPAMISSESTSVSDPKVELVFRSLPYGHCPQAMCMRLGTRHALRIKHRVRDLSTVSRQRRQVRKRSDAFLSLQTLLSCTFLTSHTRNRSAVLPVLQDPVSRCTHPSCCWRLFGVRLVKHI